MAKILLGFMGAGKTTVGRILDPNFSDLDELLVEKIGMPISQYFAQEGEASFRQLERKMLEKLLKEGVEVISPGGGIVLDPHNRQLLEKNDCNVFLKLDFDSLYERIQRDRSIQRPLFLKHTREQFKEIFDSRQALYESVATHVIEVGDKSPEEIAEMIRCL